MFAYGDNYWFMPPERRNIATLSDREMCVLGNSWVKDIQFKENMLTSSVSLGFFWNWLAQLDDNFCKLNSKSCYLLVRAKTKSHIKFHSPSQRNIREKQFHSVLCNVVLRQQAQYELDFESAFLRSFYCFVHRIFWDYDMTKSCSTSNNVVFDSAFLLLHWWSSPLRG